MLEVTIPLRPLGENDIAVNPDDYLRIIQDEYASRYSDLLGIAATPANKAAILRCRPLDDCEIHGIWAESQSSKVAEAIKIVPPLRTRTSEVEDGFGFAGFSDREQSRLHQWYGQPERIRVKPPDMPGTSTSSRRLDTNGDAGQATGAEPAADGALGRHQQSGNRASELLEELERLRSRDVVPRGVGTVAASLQNERRERQRQELESLKAKFILPFACERPASDSINGRTELRAWPTSGPLDMEVPENLAQEVMRPITLELEDIRRSNRKWVEEIMPLEMLTSRREEGVLTDIRNTITDGEVFQLIGLLSHLLYWVTIGSSRKLQQKRLSQKAMQALVFTAQKIWAQFERYNRDTPLGVCVVIPCLLLTLKRGIERCFETQYPTVMGEPSLHQKVIDRINTLLMRLYDPDNMYSRFGKVDGTGKGIALSRRLDMVATSRGRVSATRLHSRAHRATPLVHSVMDSAGSRSVIAEEPAAQSPLPMLAKGPRVPSPPRSAGNAPQEGKWRSTLLRAAMERLGMPIATEGGISQSPRRTRPAASARTTATTPRSPRFPCGPITRGKAAVQDALLPSQ